LDVGKLKIRIEGNSEALEKTLKSAVNKAKREARKAGKEWAEEFEDETKKAEPNPDPGIDEARKDGRRAGQEWADEFEDETEKAKPDPKGAGAPAGKKQGGVFGGAFVKGFGGALAAVGGIMAVDQIASGVGSAIESASGLEQSMGATLALFGDESQQVFSEWSASAATALGLTKQESLDAANAFAISGKQMGLAGDELITRSQTMTAAASDMAAMFGGSTLEASQALSAAYRGSGEQAEKYGMVLTATAIEAEAMAMGFEKVNGQLTQADKNTALDSLIKKQLDLNGVVGAFEREADTYAGAQQRLQASLANVQASFGEALLPVASSLMEGLLPAVEAFAPVMQNIGESFATAFQPMIEGLGPFIETLAGPLQSIGEQLARLAGLVMETFAPLIESFTPVFLDLIAVALETVAGILESLNLDFFVELVTVLLVQFAEHLQRILPVLGELAETLITAFMNEEMMDALMQLTISFGELFATLSENVVPILSVLFTAFGDLLNYLIDNSGVLDNYVVVLTTLSEWLGTAATAVGDFYSAFTEMSWLEDFLNGTASAITDLANSVLSTLGSMISGFLSLILSAAEGVNKIGAVVGQQISTSALEDAIAKANGLGDIAAPTFSIPGIGGSIGGSGSSAGEGSSFDRWATEGASAAYAAMYGVTLGGGTGSGGKGGKGDKGGKGNPPIPKTPKPPVSSGGGSRGGGGGGGGMRDIVVNVLIEGDGDEKSLKKAVREGIDEALKNTSLKLRSRA
jgi:hypothetical protein